MCYVLKLLARMGETDINIHEMESRLHDDEIMWVFSRALIFVEIMKQMCYLLIYWVEYS